MTALRVKKKPAPARKRPHYSPAGAGMFWTRRLASTNPLAAVLTYSAPTAVNEAYDRWERLAISDIVGKSLRRTRAVDIGAGTGRISLLLAAKGATVTSIDISEGMLKQLMRSARSANLHKAIAPVLASATRLPLASGSADLVTCCGLLEHLPLAARNAALAEAFRILAPAGKMIVVVNNTGSVFLKRQYPMKTQRSDGYFVGLVGLPWLLARARRAGLIARVRAANPWYACAYYLAERNAGSKKYSAALQSAFAGLSELDLQIDPGSPVVNQLASHYIVEVAQR